MVSHAVFDHIDHRDQNACSNDVEKDIFNDTVRLEAKHPGDDICKQDANNTDECVVDKSSVPSHDEVSNGTDACAKDHHKNDVKDHTLSPPVFLNITYIWEKTEKKLKNEHFDDPEDNEHHQDKG